MINRKAMELEMNDTNNKLGYYHYEGSQTTPTCSEDMHYFIID
jgi:carbonic anhydrase